MTRDEKINFIGRVVSGEVNRLSDDDMVVMNELSMDVGDDFSVELIEEFGSDSLMELVGGNTKNLLKPHNHLVRWISPFTVLLVIRQAM